MRFAKVFAACAALLCAGCSVDYKAEVKSSTSWSGAFGNATVDGTGDRIVDIPDDAPQCVVVQKQTTDGSLSVRVVTEGGGLFAPGDSDWSTTTATYGVVTACSE